MSEELDNIELIESYLEGKLSGADLEAFMSKLESNEQLKVDVETHQLMMEAAKEIGKGQLADELREIHQELYPDSNGGGFSNIKWVILILAVAAIGGMTLIFTKEEATDTANKTIQPIKEKVIEPNVPFPTEIKNDKAVAEKGKTPEPSPAAKKQATKSATKQAGEIILTYTGDHIPEPTLVISDTMKTGYLFNGKDLTFFNLEQDKIEGVTYMEMEQILYLFYNSKYYRLELTPKPQALIEEKDPEIIRYLNIE